MSKNKINSYEISRRWFDFSFENPSKVKPVHTALLFFIMEHSNRLGWAKEFGLPRDMTMAAIGVKNNRTFSKAFNDLESWGFITVIERAKNQYSANIISIFACVKNTPAHTNALDKAMHMQVQKQRIGIAPINKPNNLITLKPENKENLSPFQLIKKQIPGQLESWMMQNHRAIDELENLIESFNSKAMIEILSDKNDLEFNAQQLFYRFKNYAKSWISNQKPKINNHPHQTENMPFFGELEKLNNGSK